MKKVHFIVNEQAGGFKGRKVWQALKQQIQFPYEVFITTSPLSATTYVKSLHRLAESQLIIAIGGDGTLHEVINGARERKDLIIACMKGGSGNDFARGIQYFESYSEIVAFVESSVSQSKQIDVGVIETSQWDRCFINNSGLGFDAYVSYLVNESKMKKFLNRFNLGKLSYVYIMLQALFTYKPFTLSMKTDKQSEREVFQNVWFITFSNQPYFGGGMKISPDSKIDDGKVEVTLVHSLPVWKFLILFLTVYNGNHLKYKGIIHRKVEKVECELQHPVHVHMDGEAQLTENISYKIYVNHQHLNIPK